MVSSISGPNSATPAEAYAQRVVHAALQFEGVLLNSLFGSLEHAFSALPGKQPDAIADNYHAMGMQALTSSLAAGGGLGLASMIVRNLLHTKGQGAEPPAMPTKVFSPSADRHG
jgi:Rod binding domain-containing protein